MSSGVTHRSNTTPHEQATEQVAVPRGLGGVGGQGAVGAVVVNETFEIGEEVHWVREIESSVSTTVHPSFK